MDPFSYLCLMFFFVIMSSLLLAALVSPAGKRLTFWLSFCDVFLCVCRFPI